jgi:Autotransporter beta-domain/Extended Signal Peptide of Type V secretion system
MNKSYRLIKNKLTGATSVAHEFAKGHGSVAVKKSLVALAVASAITSTASVYADTTIQNSTLLGPVYISDNNDGGLNQILSNSLTISSEITIHSGPPDGSAIPLIIYSQNNPSAISAISSNKITNNGSLDAYNSGIEFLIFGQGQLADSQISSNTITNTGKISVYGDADSSLSSYMNYASNGISLFAGSRAQNGATAQVNNNVVLNSGTIGVPGTAYMHTGIALQSYAKSDNASATATVSNNTITNTGKIIATSDESYQYGVLLKGIAIGSTMSNAAVSYNTFNNSGKIYAGYHTAYLGAGVGLVAYAYTSSSSVANVNGNKITNSGDISGYGFGLRLAATANGFASATATVSNNVISNTGKIYGWPNNGLNYGYISNADAIRLSAIAYANTTATATVSGNTIINSGLVKAYHDGIYTTAFTSGYTATAVNSNNLIQNSGNITSLYSHGVHVATYANGAVSATANTNNNVITNLASGVVEADEQAIKIRANAYASGGGSYRSNSNATINSNIIANAGLLKTYATSRAVIDLYSYSKDIQSHSDLWSNGHVNYGHGMDVRSYSHAQSAINSNTIVNTGTITATSNGNGINLIAYSEDHATSNANADRWRTGGLGVENSGVNHEARSYATSETTVNNNVISNSGQISAKGTGINLYAGSQTYSNANANVSNSNDPWQSTVTNTRAYSNTTSSVLENTIQNTGAINATGDGISLNSNANNKSVATTTLYNIYNRNTGNGNTYNNTYVNDQSFATATATTSSNVIVNTGHITSGGDAINLTANSSANTYSNMWLYSAGQTRFGEGSPFSDNVLRATSRVDGNVVINTGSIAAANTAIRLNATANVYGYTNHYFSNYNAYAKATVNGNTIVNTGLITADTGISLHAHTHGLFTNYANIEAYNYDSYNRSDISGNTIINTGVINSTHNGIEVTASMTGAYGSANITDNIITNTGTIRSGGIGIYVTNYNEGTVSNNTINNSGKIVSTAETPVAIRVVGDNNTGESSNTLNLSAPGFIAGQLQLDDGLNLFVNLKSGQSHSVLWTFANTPDYSINPDNVSTSGPNPWFRNNTNLQFATIDPTAFSAAPNILADTTEMASRMSSIGLDNVLRSANKETAWMSVQGSHQNYDGNGLSTLNQSNNLYGIAVGYGKALDDGTVVNALAGYNRNDLYVNSVFTQSYRNNINGAFVGLAAHKALGPFVADLGINAGYMSHSDDRFVNDNLATLGNSHAKANYNSFWLAPEAKIAYPISVSESYGVVFSPRASVRYSGQWIDGYTESGSNSNATVGSRNIGVFDAKVGAELAKNFESGKISVYGDYLHRDATGDSSVGVTMIGDTHTVSFYYQNLDAVVVGASAAYYITDMVSIEAGGNWIQGNNTRGGNATASVKYFF